MPKFVTKRHGAVALALAVGLVIGTAGLGIATDANRQMPADKTAVAGATLIDIGENEEEPILQQRMKVSSPADLILGTTLECSILTRLVTNNDDPSAEATGKVEIRIEIDGKEVPVQTAGPAATGPEGDGSVTFCNRTYQRTVTDGEDPADGIDQEDDYIDTKAANAFNWVALNVGVDESQGGYDSLANGNNIIDIKVFARYTRTPTRCVENGVVTCSDAYVGKRTLVIEPVHAANGEQSEPAGSSTSGGGSSGGLSIPGV